MPKSTTSLRRNISALQITPQNKNGRSNTILQCQYYRHSKLAKNHQKLGMVAHALNLSTYEAEALWTWGQPVLHNNRLSQKVVKKPNITKKQRDTPISLITQIQKFLIKHLQIKFSKTWKIPYTKMKLVSTTGIQEWLNIHNQ